MTLTRRLVCIGLLLALVLPTLELGRRGLAVKVDAANLAMKSVGTPEERAYRRRVEEFGEDNVVVFALAGNSRRPEQIDAFAEGLLAVPGVVDVVDLPLEETGWPVFAVLIEGDRKGGGYAETAERLERRARSLVPPGLELLATGQPLAELAIAEGVHEESRRLLPWVAGVLVLLLTLRYRRPALILAALFPPFAAIAWVSGIYASWGFELDPVSSLLQPVLLTVGVAGAVHLNEAYLRSEGKGLPLWDSVVEAVREIAWPSALAMLTTCAGFLTLGVHTVPAVRRFGMFAAFGVALAFALTMVGGPALLLLQRRVGKPHPLSRRSRPELQGLEHWILRHGAGVIVVSLALTAAAAGCWGWLTVDTDPAAVLPASHPFRRDFARLTARLGGVEVFDLLVPADRGRPRDLDPLETLLESRPEIVAVVDRRHAENGDGLLTAVVRPSGTTARERLFDQLEKQAARIGAAGTVATGTIVRVARDSGQLVRHQLLASALALVALLLAGWAATRSTGLALLGLLPNIVPCVLVYGALAAAGRPISVATAMIASVMLGLIVDDTLHFLTRYSRARRVGLPLEGALALAFDQAGTPMTLTSLVLSAGFAVPLVAGSLVTTREFGALAVATIILALVADLLLLPALLLVRSRREAR